MKKSLTPPLLASLALLSVGYAQEPAYQLQWSDTQTQPAPIYRSYQEQRSLDNAGHPPPPVARVDLPVARVPDLSPQRGALLRPRAVRPSSSDFDIQVVARQHFDHEKDRYLRVQRVESVVTRTGRYPQSEVHCNRARHTEFDVHLQDLQPGDRYQVRVVWEDGSQRTVENTIDQTPLQRVLVDEPAPFEFAPDFRP